MNWTCEQVEARLSDYTDGLLDTGQRREFAAHAADCPRCAPLVQSVSALLGRLHGLEPLEPPPRLVYNILDRTVGPRKEKKGWRAWLAWLRPVWQPRFAYGAASLVITLTVLLQATGFQWRKPKLADLNPANVYRVADRRAHLLYARGARFVTDLRVVYEIQSRLRPEPEPQPAPAQKSNPGQTNGPQPRSPRGLHRAREYASLQVLACALPALPARSLP